MSDLTLQGARSIATAEEGHKFILIADEAIQARLAALRAIKKAEGGEQRYLEHLAETQKLSVVTIEAVIRTGELLVDLKKVPVMEPSLGKAPLRGSEPSLPPNIDKKRSYMYQTLKKNETEVRELAQKALEGELLTIGGWDFHNRQIPLGKIPSDSLLSWTIICNL